jgi:hypothetical protein
LRTHRDIVPGYRESICDCNPAVEWRPGRTWSLWDLMHKLRADIFFKAYEQAATLHQMLMTLPQGASVVMPPRDRLEQVERLTVLVEELTTIGMTGAAASVSRGLELLKAAPEVEHEGKISCCISFEDRARIQTALSQGTSRVPDDLVGRVLLVIDPPKVCLYNQPAIFGDEVFKAFSSANEDISEAGTCLSLDRGTACVMHLQRVIEVGLSALAAAVQVPKQNDWGSYLREIDVELTRRMKASGARSPDEQFYAEAAVAIDHMRRAWRNPTMHPEKTYPTERAEEILDSVRSFMRHLATKLHE